MTMKSFEVGDKVYKFINGSLSDGVYIIAKKDEKYLYVIPTDCTINGEVPTLGNYEPERFGLEGDALVAGYARISIHKVTDELKKHVEAFRTRKLIIEEILKALKCNNHRQREATEDVLWGRTTSQLFGMFSMLVGHANGKSGTVRVNDDGKMDISLFMKEELVNNVKEPNEV